ncbi:MAG TPA: ABC transporter permease subunit [Pseudolabrys sp.]|nr:ABC transporter permease subunit [Pseudolabrys sp.]
MTDAAARIPAGARFDFWPRLFGLVTICAALLVAEFVIRGGLINRFIVPPPSEVIQALYRVVVQEHVFRRFLATAAECLIAGSMLTLVGVATGVAMHRYKLLQQACETWVASIAAAPLVIMYPLFLVVFGRNALTIIMMGFIAGLPPAILKTIEGLAATRKVLVNVGKSFKLTGPQQFWKILFPAALPTIFVGVRLGLIFALINVVGTEFLISYGGLGALIADLAERYDLAGTYAAICFVILVSVLCFVLLEKIERWLRPVD